MIILTSVIYGIGGALLIAFSFRNSLDIEKAKSLKSYSSMQSMLSVVNSVSDQTNVSDVANVLTALSRRNTEWDALRLTDGKKQLFLYDKAFPFDNEMKKSCSDMNCAVKIAEIDGVHFRQITGTFYVGDTLLYLDAAVNVEDLYTARREQIRIYRWLYAAVVLLSAIVSFLSAHFMTVPMRTLSRISRRIAEGDLSVRARVKSGDEMEAFSLYFNRMAESLTSKIQELQDAMEQQERFMGSFAHELKTPMTSMIGYADLIRSCELPETERRECAEYIFREGQRLERLSFKLLDLLVLKKRDFSFSETNISQLIDEIAAAIEPKLKSCGVYMTVQTEPGSCSVEPDLLKSLLINLIDNALKSMENGGRIRLRQNMTKEGCRIIVRDSGRGIPQADLKKITEAFYRVDKSRSRRQGGAGLGLALCSEIVELHGGTMEFFSELGKGTAVVIELKGGAI